MIDLLNSPDQDKKIYSVSELNRETKNLLSSHFYSIQVEGEISNLTVPSSGHFYFSLKDKRAQIRCAMFKSQQRQLDFKPANGQQIIITAQVSLYEARGDYQLIVNKMQEAGAGDLQLAFDRLKNKLLAEGLFEQTIKKSLPKIPQQIGVITSPSGAVIHDILSVLKRRFPSIPIIIYPTAVQGELAKYEISAAIETANEQKQVDVILLARGGGSIEDLWAFNEECVARAIVASEIPIISSVGHETDFTIADFVADLRAPTPSVAAETVVPDQQSWLNKFQAIEYQLQQIMQRRFVYHHQSIQWLNKRLQQQHPGQQLQRYSQSLDNLELRLLSTIRTKLTHKTSRLDKQHTMLHRQNPATRIQRYVEQQHYLTNRLNTTIRHKLESLQSKYLSLVKTLNAVSPLATLDRGYAIVRNSETAKVIIASEELSINDQITTRFAKGEIISQVKEIKHA